MRMKRGILYSICTIPVKDPKSEGQFQAPEVIFNSPAMLYPTYRQYLRKRQAGHSIPHFKMNLCLFAHLFLVPFQHIFVCHFYQRTFTKQTDALNVPF